MFNTILMLMYAVAYVVTHINKSLARIVYIASRRHRRKQVVSNPIFKINDTLHCVVE